MPRGTKRTAASSPAGSTPHTSPAVDCTHVSMSSVINPLLLAPNEQPVGPNQQLGPPATSEQPQRPQESPFPMAFNISAAPFQPAEPLPSSAAVHPTLSTDADCKWELCRVREFWCDGNISDYDDLEELEAEQRSAEEEHLEDEQNDSDYADDKSSDADDFEVSRMGEMDTFRKFSRSMVSKSRLLAVVGISSEESLDNGESPEIQSTSSPKSSEKQTIAA